MKKRPKVLGDPAVRVYYHTQDCRVGRTKFVFWSTILKRFLSMILVGGKPPTLIVQFYLAQL